MQNELLRTILLQKHYVLLQLTLKNFFPPQINFSWHASIHKIENRFQVFFNILQLVYYNIFLKKIHVLIYTKSFDNYEFTFWNPKIWKKIKVMSVMVKPMPFGMNPPNFRANRIGRRFVKKQVWISTINISKIKIHT